MSGAAPAPEEREVRLSHWSWVITRTIAQPLYHLLGRFRGVGRANMPSTGGVLLVSNHVSGLDPPVVGYAADRAGRKSYFMAKKELFRHRWIGRFISSLGAFPVDRGRPDRAAIRTARELLARGEVVIMFPEGTRSLDGRLRPAFPGAGMLALEKGVTVLPAAVWGTQRVRGPWTVALGPPVDMSDLATGPRAARVQEATRRMMQAVADLVPAAGGPPQVVAEGDPSFPGAER